MIKKTAAQKRLLENATLIAATRLVFDELRQHFPIRQLSDAMTIFNGRALKKSNRVIDGEYDVYGSGGKVGRFSDFLSDKPFVVIGRKGSAGKPTYAPNGGWVIDTAYYAQPSNSDIDTRFLFYALSSLDFSDDIISTAIPGINQTAIYSYDIPVPPIELQIEIKTYLDAVAEKTTLPKLSPPFIAVSHTIKRVEALTSRITAISAIKEDQRKEIQYLLLSLFKTITENVRWLPMRDVAPLVRRPIQIDASIDYPELGIRSFGRGTFHKPAISGVMLGTKRLFRIEPRDLIFNNVFAWEGAVAVAKNEDVDRFGSHRFITCLPIDKLATSDFLCFYFLTREGLEKLGTASPGGAGRNRTLGLNALENILVPVPEYDKQVWFDSVQARLASLRELQSETQEELSALLPSVLDRAFKGEL